MLIPMLAAIYVVLCLLIGFAMRKRRMGFVLATALSIVITPILMFLLLALTDFPKGHNRA